MNNTNSQTTTNTNLQEDLEFEKLYRGEIDQINKEMGLFLPPNLSPEMTSVWEEFFDILRYMYNFEVLDLFYVRKYLFDFFEMAKKEPDELERKKTAVQVMRQKAKESAEEQKEILRLFYAGQYTKNIEKIYNQLESEEEKVDFLKMIYNGNLPPEIQATIDQNNAPQFTPEEIEQMHRKAVADATIKYRKHGLNLGQTGTVLTAAQIAEFVDADGDGENDLEETLPKQEIKKIKTLPDLPNNSDMSIPKNNISDFNTSSQNNSQKSPNFQSQNSQNIPNGQKSLQNSQKNGSISQNNSQNNLQNSVQNVNQSPNQSSNSAEFVPDFGNNKFTRFRNPPSS